MQLKIRDGLALVLVSSVALASGCGGRSGAVATPESRKEMIQESSLSQLGDILRVSKESGERPPAKLADLLKYERAFGLAVGRLRSGEIVYLYNAGFEEGASDKVLAYLKATPETGGPVLMQDGTVKKMTADEFKAAPRAPGGSAPAVK